ncbi:hypothetical protein EC991_003249 [Linnemannia zychae]|nr:hypothetical protein EC991_003249 [Linnemannia zychae]
MVFATSRLAAFAAVLCSVLSVTSAFPISIDNAATAAGSFAAENRYNVKCPNMCKGIAPVNSTDYFCRDARLGPKRLPKLFPLNDITQPYDRFGGLCAAEFLAKWTVNGSYTYPDNDGFMISTANTPIKGNATLPIGTLIDRFGSEYGSFLAPAEAPYPQRSIPPSNLDTPKDQPNYPFNYRVYRVKQPLLVEAGPIAPYFGQPGAGTQYRTFSNIMTLIANGFLERIDLKHV